MMEVPIEFLKIVINNLIKFHSRGAYAVSLSDSRCLIAIYV